MAAAGKLQPALPRPSPGPDGEGGDGYGVGGSVDGVGGSVDGGGDDGDGSVG